MNLVPHSLFMSLVLSCRCDHFGGKNAHPIDQWWVEVTYAIQKSELAGKALTKELIETWTADTKGQAGE